MGSVELLNANSRRIFWMVITSCSSIEHDSRNGMAIEIDATTLTLILSGVDLTTAKRRKRYRVERASSASR